jgi:hypothetical protein
MIGGKVLATKFPQRGIEISHIDDVASGVADFDAITDLIRTPHEYENPGDKTPTR